MPGNSYNIRVSATNASGNTAFGSPVRVQTGYEDTSSNDTSGYETAVLRTTSSHVDNVEPGPHIKDGAIGPRASVIRKTPPVGTQKMEQVGKVVAALQEDTDEDESSEDIERLVTALEDLKKHKEDVDQQIEEEEFEHKVQNEDLIRERERLQHVLKEREEESAALRRQGPTLENQKRAAQTRKAAKERELQQLRSAREKTSKDIMQKNQEIAKMKYTMDQWEIEKGQRIAETDAFKKEKSVAIEEDKRVKEALEKEVHDKGILIKELGEKFQDSNSSGEGQPDQEKAAKEDEKAWEIRVQGMNLQMTHWHHALQQASMEEQHARDILKMWLDRRAKFPGHFAPLGFDNTTSSQTGVTRTNHSNSRASTVSNSGYPGGPIGVDSGMPSAPTGSSPYFDAGNGLPPSLSDTHPMSQADINLLTGGATMSPAADRLLPSNLFRDEEMAGQSPLDRMESRNRGGSDVFARHAISNSDASMPGPNTPGSAASRPGSMLPSPRDSVHNLPAPRSRSDTFEGNTDRNLLHSTSGPFHASLTVESNPLEPDKLTNIFSSPFSRQRGKASIDDTPPLGTLKQGQSQSFPRNVEQEEVGVVGARRRKGSHSHWANPMGLLARGSSQPEEDRLITARTSSGRRSRLNMFGSRFDSSDSTGLADQTSSSRPPSTYSDQAFARPSGETQIQNVWKPTADEIPGRNSPLAASKWPQGTIPWPAMQSRRGSAQRGSTTNLSIGSIPLDPDELSGSLKKQKSEQAPIGTRPQSSQRPSNLKLNPAAPSFKTIFGRGDSRKASKTEKLGVKSTDKTKERDDERGELKYGETPTESSPADPRLSRDAQSITTANSTTDSHDSFDRSISGTPSEVTTPGPKEPKESLMQKISRKSSSSKFNVPWSKDRGFFSKRTGEPSTPGGGEVDEEHSGEGQTAKGTDSTTGTPQHEKPGRTSLTWPNIRKKSKKGGDLTDKSSEAGEDED